MKENYENEVSKPISVGVDFQMRQRPSFGYIFREAMRILDSANLFIIGVVTSTISVVL